jgi:hypothetical protein
MLQAFVCWSASKLGYSECRPVSLSSSACSLLQTTRYCLAGKAGTDFGAKASSQPQGEPVPDLLTPCLAGPATRSVLAGKQEDGVRGPQPVQIQALRERQKGYRSYPMLPNSACKLSHKREAERLPLILGAAQQSLHITFKRKRQRGYSSYMELPLSLTSESTVASTSTSHADGCFPVRSTSTSSTPPSA